MRQRLAIFLIMLMTALPIWSAFRVCHHVQVMPQTVTTQATNHHCCLEMQKQQSEQVATDACHCDQLQHAQFVLSVPVLLAAVPPDSFIPPVFSPQLLPEAADVLYRPPIA